MASSRNKKIRKNLGLVGFPMDLGADRRGVDMGPSALRYTHLEHKLENLGYNVKDFGDIDIEISQTLMELVADCGCMNSLEILEVNPILDRQNKTAELTTDLICLALGKNTLFD